MGNSLSKAHGYVNDLRVFVECLRGTAKGTRAATTDDKIIVDIKDELEDLASEIEDLAKDIKASAEGLYGPTKEMHGYARNVARFAKKLNDLASGIHISILRTVADMIEALADDMEVSIDIMEDFVCELDQDEASVYNEYIDEEDNRHADEIHSEGDFTDDPWWCVGPRNYYVLDDLNAVTFAGKLVGVKKQPSVSGAQPLKAQISGPNRPLHLNKADKVKQQQAGQVAASYKRGLENDANDVQSKGPNKRPKHAQ